MDIIFITLPKYLASISILLQKCGHRVYYLKLSGYENIDKENINAKRLKKAGVLPLPIEDLESFKGFSTLDSDPGNMAYERTQEIAPKEFLCFFEKLFPNIPDISKKLLVAVHSTVTNQWTRHIGKVNIWADAHPNQIYLLIDVTSSALIDQKPRQNVKLLIIPLDIFNNTIDMIFSFFYQILHSQKTSATIAAKKVHSKEVDPIDPNKSRIALIIHQGLNYGNLYRKDLFYSSHTNSELNIERLLHFDYSGVSSPSEKIKWACIGTHRQSMFSNFYSALVAIKVGLPHIRHWQHILGLLILTRFYVVYRSFSKKLEVYPSLKIALIDYEILCPKELLLAFENRGIRTVAVQERMILSFYKLYGSTILSHYLCSSPYAADAMKNSPLYLVDYYLPVGQYRSDNLLEAKKSPPPEILEAALAKGLRIITALGFHTHMEWQNSQPDLLINWKGHQHFLNDMIRLSCEIPNVFIILRYKTVDWMALPIFIETLQKIKATDNMTISTDYETFNISYDLCAHSDLVIAKHTSLGDECLSVGIPVLFHEYTHNTERLIADAFDYSPTKVMCFNYQELKERAQIILSGTPNAMTEDYEYLKNVVYGGLRDGRVKERIHAHIEKMIAEL